MAMIRHVNIPNAEGEIYCCLRNRLVTMDKEQRLTFCGGCKMYQGDAAGQGVTCDWNDAREVDNPLLVTDPYAEWSSNQAKTTPTSTLNMQLPYLGQGIFIAEAGLKHGLGRA